ncbi:high-affinity branched-chain amino acid transport ATP-binding protein LivF [Variibacter gotjawalensis]|uniref:High-affinity branched-chain amino acid transport ATP-binding protein LivF n=1 Tax=Variibacter gotjawalensis TaxID=1333996 RepID=A0A0S3PUF8_9BRAD|nr:ABC transporter ATP-binding protein [Variibacter gotjawalensis]NIK49776.1 branched-chain amino acid transport system ATP-binding protein [Variibacter gotjawalensis]RZS45781.1 amino acid/amide ABC transporter ATP-binding protein 2 (HAAT family) [Variibacter gotjawalensis]BAT59454.1 high-affinity branched-chain amino acid transport ATP-binding protein LivF [Variibacter gotjawalensis]
MLRITDLCAGYGQKQVLREVSLDVPRGAVVAILGANGAGKSTLLKSIVGLVRATSGSITLDQKPLANESPDRALRSGIALVAEQRELFKSMSVADNLMLGGFLRRGTAECLEDFEKLLDVFPRLRERSKQPARTLSGGEQQMLAIARALMARPSYLLLDEPSLGLAPRVVEEIFAIVRRVSAEGVAIVIVEQNVSLALDVAQNGYVMEVGAITVSGASELLRTMPAVQQAYL